MMQVEFLRGVSRAAEARTRETDSILIFMRLLDRLWRDRPEPHCSPLQVGVAFILADLPTALRQAAHHAIIDNAPVELFGFPGNELGHRLLPGRDRR